MNLFAYIDRDGTVSWNIEDDACLPDGDLGFLKKRFPKCDMYFEDKEEEEE